MENDNEYSRGIVSGLIAYLFWGIFPLYWKLVETVSSEEILAHRIFWSLITVFIFTLVFKPTMLKSFFQSIRNSKKLVLFLLVAACFVTLNWYTYIWAVNHHHIVDSSLGYYINPLVNVLIGSIFLKEKLDKTQWFSFSFAFIGVAILWIDYGHIPYIALSLALTFSFYGLVKKKISLDANMSLFGETLFVVPLALGYLIFLNNSSALSFGNDSVETILLIGAGVVTSIPLLFFGYAAQRIPFYMIGFMQYISPTIQLLIGIFLFKESFSFAQGMAFSIIWIGLIVFTYSTTKSLRTNKTANKFSA